VPRPRLAKNADARHVTSEQRTKAAEVLQRFQGYRPSGNLTSADESALGTAFETTVGKTDAVCGGRSISGTQNFMVAVRLAPVLVALSNIDAARRLYRSQRRPRFDGWRQAALSAPRRTLGAAIRLLRRPALETLRHALVGGLSLDDRAYLEEAVRFGRALSVSVEACLFVVPGTLNESTVIDVAGRGIRVVETLDANATMWWDLAYRPVGCPFSFDNLLSL